MTLAELIAEVYIITGRPDLVNETASAIRKATLQLHSVDYFYRDLQETIETFSTPAYKQQLDLSLNLSSYRALKYVREWNSTPTGKELFLEKVEADAILDYYNIEGRNIFYVAGTVLNMKCQNKLTNIVIGYYKNPNIGTNTYASWIAVEQPYAIVELAASNLLQMVGHSELARKYEGFTAQNVVLLKQNYLDPQAR